MHARLAKSVKSEVGYLLSPAEKWLVPEGIDTVDEITGSQTSATTWGLSYHLPLGSQDSLKLCRSTVEKNELSFLILDGVG